MGLGKHNLAVLGEQSFERHGDYDSIFFEGRWYSTGELFERTRKLAGGLIELGIEPGDRVMVMMANGPEVGISYGALWRAGAVITPAIFLLSPDELRHILQDSEARAVITTPEFVATIKGAADGVDSVKWIISTGEEEDGVISMSSLENAEPTDIVPREDDDLAALMYTGGTTGRAKGVMLSHSNWWHAGKAAFEASNVPGLDRTLVCLPLSHSFGLLVSVVGLHSTQRQVTVLQRWPDPNEMLPLLAEHKIHGAPLVPSMIQMLLALPLEDHDLSELKYIVSGASPLAPEVAREIERRIPGIEVREGYGLTETSASTTVNPPNARKIGSVGKPMSGFEIRLADDDSNEVPEGEVGEITVRSKSIMQGYWKSPEATEEAVKDGWFYTGDIGRLDEDGYLYIVDRKKDLILRGGFNVFPRDVEDALLEHPAVAVAGVVGKPDELRGEEVVAFVQLAPGQEVTPEDLIEFSRERLGKYKYPREVRIVESVPLTPVGKIDRKVIRAQVVAEGQS
ncbi:MAG TPA: AMP-binding protein [Actinomycetota bacterium]|nr:AMP-binding protein [Actinomycetota bacterium]